MSDRKLRRLDAEFTTAALMGTMDVEGCSIAGRMATNVAAQVERKNLQEKRKRENAEMIRIIMRLRDTLVAIDRRIYELDQNIAELQIELAAAEKKSQEAFDRMHELETVLAEADTDGFTDPRRARLCDAIGPEADKARDDDTLRSMAETRIDQERDIGTDAFERAEEIRNDIEAKKAIRSKLEQSRKDILSDPNLSAEEKTMKLQKALDESLSVDVIGTEIDQKAALITETSRSIDEKLISDTDDRDFDFDEDQEITLTVKPDTPAF